MFIPWTWLAIPVAALALFGVGWWQGSEHEADKATHALLLATQKARHQEAQWQASSKVLQEKKDAEIQSVRGQLRNALSSLRNRPAKRLSETPASCAGASPTALSAEDAGVALGIAADADELRASYAQCKAFVESLK